MADFDAIVVGSGLSGGWVAKELCERGLKVLVLDRGDNVEPAKDYSDMLEPWQKPHLDQVSPEVMESDFSIQGGNYALKASNKHLWMTDSDQPYEAVGGKFKWRRGSTIGGKSLMWGRASYRLAPYDFEVNKIDGEGVDWPVRYKDIAPWYDKVEKFVGIAGDRDGMAQLPDGEHFLPAFEHTCVEKKLKKDMAQSYDNRRLIMGRVANLTLLTEEQRALGRGQCQARNHCFHGCTYGAYFSSVSATLPAAKKTGNMTLVSNSIVTELVYDPTSEKIKAVNVLDSRTRQTTSYSGKIFFLNAGTISTTLLMLRSASESMPNGLANSSDQLGRNFMDHIGGSKVEAKVEDFADSYYYGRRPIGAYIPRYRNFPKQKESYKRGWGYQVYSGRVGAGGWKPGVGKTFKESNQNPGQWSIMLDHFGECLPYATNRVTAHKNRTDKWGQPIAVINLQLGENEKALMRAAHADAIDILKRSGFTNISEVQKPDDFMDGIEGRTHYMGTARMGRDPKTSVLNGWNQAHDIPNLFVTDGSFMASSACQNPSLTFMAFSARAAHHAADLLSEGNL